MVGNEVRDRTPVTRLRQLGVAMLVVGLLSAVFVVADAFANAGPAQARCGGEGNYRTSTYWEDGERRVSERPTDGTCNSNSFYAATLTDVEMDGAVVQVRIRDGAGQYVVVAETGSSTGYNWTDVTVGGTSSWMQLCAIPGFGCGFGRETGAEGLNWGY